MEAMLVWGLSLLGAAVVIGVLEFVLPTGGVLGVMAAVVAIAGVVCLYLVGPEWGGIGTLGLLILGPAAVYLGFKTWPHTAVGRQIIGTETDEQRHTREQTEQEARARVAAMIGKEGVVLTDLRPVGTVQVDGVRYDALSDTMFVRAGARVKVIGTDVAQLRVREVR
ncbi:MAG: NfeD family protein [Planctomycetota bacterium]|nr:NfeD family protein [Planctomycetota bacterium]